MKFNISDPLTGVQKKIEVDDEHKLRHFYDQRVSTEIEGEKLGDDFNGYIFRISGGNDKQGFPMKQGVLTSARVRLLLGDGHSCFRERRVGSRKRKSVRGCIISSEISIVNLVIVKKGPNEIPGLTDSKPPRRLGPKRASKLRRLANLGKGDDVRQVANLLRRTIKEADGKKKAVTKAPKIQRLITPQRLQHKRQIKATLRTRWEVSRKLATVYNEKIQTKLKSEKEARHAKHVANRSISRKVTGDKK